MAQGVAANISKEELSELLQNYTMVDIAKKLNVSVATIKRYKAKYGLSVNLENARKKNSEAHTKYPCNNTYFDNIDTMDKAYLLGFICADGFVTDRNEIGIGVAEKDKKIVEFFQQQLQSSKPIVRKDGKHPSVELRIQNNYLCEQLMKLGVFPNKSLILDIKTIIANAKLSEKQISAFLLGYFDGDGCISKAHRQIDTKEYFEMNITGTLETIQYFKDYFGHGCVTKRHNDDKNNYTLQFSNNYSTIYNALSKLYAYRHELTFYFLRKYNLFAQLELIVKS